MHGDDVAEAHAQVLAHHLVHADLTFLAKLVGENDAHGVLALFTLEQHGVASEKLKLVHLLQVQRDDGVVVVHRLVCDPAKSTQQPHATLRTINRPIAAGARAPSANERGQIPDLASHDDSLQRKKGHKG